MENWYKMEVDETVKTLGSDAEKGLSSEEAARLLEKHGPNELIDRGIKSPWKILWEQLTGLMVLILIVAALISGILGEFTDVIVIMIIVVLNAALGFFQEYKAEKAMAALKKVVRELTSTFPSRDRTPAVMVGV